MNHIDRITLEEMLGEIRKDANVKDANEKSVDDIDWIIDTYNHLFGTHIE